MKIKNLFLTLLAFSALAVGGCSGPADGTSGQSHTHSFEGAWVTDDENHWKVCSDANCDEIAQKAAHQFVDKGVIEATCEQVEHHLYECSICGYKKLEYTGSDLKAHKYEVKITKEATCVEEGEITSTCTECGKQVVTKYSDPDAHTYGAGVVEGNITTYKCVHFDQCHKERKVIDAKTQTTAQVSTADLKQAGEVELKEAAIAFPEGALESFGENVSISAEPKTTADIANLNSEAKEKIGDRKIIDFNFKDGDKTVSVFDGSLTIALPYELREGEDPNGVVVWYLDENGEPENIEATYRNGNAVFETSHFSYYAVLHMSPEELCEQFGHHEVKALSVASTCVAHGYEDYACRRCGASRRVELPLINHDWQFVEKVDSTHTTEGYIKYKCSMCESYTKSVIAKKTDNDRGFYFTLLRSLGTTDLHGFGVMNSRGEENQAEIFYGSDNEGLPMAHVRSSSDGYEYVSGFYKGYTVSDSLYKSEMPVETMNGLSQFGQIADLIPGSIADLVEKGGEVLEKIIIEKNEVPEGYELKLSKEKVLKVLKSFLEKTLGEALAETFGQEEIDKIIDFVAKSYDSTVGEVLADLEARGFVAKEIYESAKGIAQIISPEAALEFPEFDEIQAKLDQIKDTKVIDIAKSAAASAHIQADLVPANGDAIKALVKQLFDQNAIELVEGFMSMIRGGGNTAPAQDVEGHEVPVKAEPVAEELEPAEQPSMADQIYAMVEQYLSVIEFSLKTGADGSFISASVVISDMSAFGTEGKMYFLFEKGTAEQKEAAIASLADLTAKCDKKQNAFKISADNYKWFTEESLNNYSDVEFEYVQEYENQYFYSYSGGEGYAWEEPVLDPSKFSYPAALVSKTKVKYNIRWDEPASSELTSETPVWEEEKPQDKASRSTRKEVEGKLVIILNDNYYVETIKNYTGYGTRLAKNELGLRVRSSNLVRGALFQYDKVTEAGTMPATYRIGEWWDDERVYTEKEFLYSFSQDKYFSTSGSYDYMYEYYSHQWKYSVISKAEYIEHNPDFERWEHNPEAMYKFVFYKAICEDCGEVRYSYFDTYKTSSLIESRYVGGYNSYICNSEMNDEALENIRSFTLNSYYNGISIETRLNIDYSRFEKEENVVIEETGVAYKIGNVDVKFTPRTGTNKCTSVLDWSVSIGSKVLKKGTNTYHSIHFGENAEPIVETITDGCRVYKLYSYVCQDCGKTYFSGYSYNETHDWQVMDSVEPTSTEPGHTLYECTKCHEHHMEWKSPCDHSSGEFIEENGKTYYVCNNCGFKIESNGDIPLITLEDLGDDEKGDRHLIGYSWNYWHYGFDYRVTYNYDYFLVVQHRDENGEWNNVGLPAETGVQIYSSWYSKQYSFEYEGQDYSTWFSYHAFAVSAEDWARLQAQLEGDDYRIAFYAISQWGEPDPETGENIYTSFVYAL